LHRQVSHIPILGHYSYSIREIMMDEMTTWERVKRMYQHKEADRVPITDGPWASTIERWHREGLPEDVSYVDYFDLDKFMMITVDNGPRFPVEVIEETDDYTIVKTDWGVTLKNWRHTGGVPEFLDFTIKDADSWAKVKERITPTDDRINWEFLKGNYKNWRDSGMWISGLAWFGFDVTHSWMVGTERVLMAMASEPEWIVDIWNHTLDTNLKLLDMVWDAGYTFDELHWMDDMGYKGRPFFSLNMYRELLKPVHKRAADWAHNKGISVRLHSCGDVRTLIPDLIEIGVDMLNPIEVKAGMDPIALKKQYGDKLGFHGGLNAVLYEYPDKMWAEMEKVIPVMKKDGGYIISSDHSVPDSVSLQEFGEFIDHAKKLAEY
jgi:uroporphyrinogen decarboxylase